MRISVRNLLIANICYWGWYSVLYGFGVYTLARISSLRDLVLKVFLALSTCTVIVGLMAVTVGGQPHLMRNLAYFWIGCGAAMAGLRMGLVSFHRYVRPHMRKRKNLIIVGTGPQAQRAYLEMELHPEWRYNFLGFVDSDPQMNDMTQGLILGSMEQFETILMQRVVDEVVIALPMKSQYDMVARAVDICELGGVQSQYQSDYFGSEVTKKRYFEGIGATRVVMQVVHHDSRRFLKRAIDVVASTFGIIMLSPLLLGAALAVATSRGPIIFKQERYGLNKRKFTMYKFRSMVIDAEKKQAQVEHLNEMGGPTFKIKNDPRVTRIGAIHAQTLHRRTAAALQRPARQHVARGPAPAAHPRREPLLGSVADAPLQREARSDLPVADHRPQRYDFDRWVELDLQYIDNWSLGLDAQILFKTLPAVLKGKGAS